MNKNQLTSLYDVEKTMLNYVEKFRGDSKLSSFNPFLYTYLLVTKEVAKNKENFEDFKNLEKLDVTFANYFFNPLEKVLKGEKASKPWQTYFDYCRNTKGNYFLKMLLGINAHINGDLAVSLFESKANNKDDFLRINTILLKVTPKVMRYLTFEYKDVYGFGAWLLKPLTIYEFNQTAVKWRNRAWEDYEKVKTINDKQKKEDIYEGAEKTGKELINIFADKTPKGFLNLLPKLNAI